MVSQMAKFLGKILVTTEQDTGVRQVDRDVHWKSHRTSLQAEIDRFFFHAANIFLAIPGAGLWSFLPSIQFQFLSSDAVWKIAIGEFLLLLLFLLLLFLKSDFHALLAMFGLSNTKSFDDVWSKEGWDAKMASQPNLRTILFSTPNPSQHLPFLTFLNH